MTKDQVRSTEEALRIALEALEDLGNHDRICPQWPTYAEPENYPKCNCGYDQAITAIKAALEAKDEPVAWMNAHDVGFKKSEFGNTPTIPLYTTPPQRTWIGLTDEEVNGFSDQYWDDDNISMQSFIKAIEAKLKEKNT